MSDLEPAKRSISVTLDEIKQGESDFKAKHGVDIADQDEWQSLGEIVSRIEAKLLARMPDKPAAAVAEEVV
jgi:hypothetical protein